MQKDKRLRKGTKGLYKKKFKQIRTQKPILSLTSQALRVTDERGKGKVMKKAFAYLKGKYKDFRKHRIKVTSAPCCLLPKLTFGCSKVAGRLTSNSS